jgi:hypothetical protein
MTTMFALSKNHYEEIIDNEMLDLIVEKYQLSDDEKKKIKGVSVEKKRLAILSFLDENRGLYKEITRMINTKNVSESTHIDEVVTMLRTYVKVSDVEKKTLGEVMTPLELVEDILNTLPEDVWSNPSLRWLDPCNGVGVFPSMVVQRLMSGLATAIPNEERRYKHIIENMLYVCELQPKNMFLFQCAFDPQDKYFLNTYVGSFLSENFTHHAHNLWGVDKFDIIIGNPPYQTNNEGETKTHPIWQKFVQNSFEHLVEGGYLCMVHPNGWRNIDGQFKDTQKIMTSRQMLYIELHNGEDGMRTFGALTTYDFYCIKNEANNGILTKIKCQDSTIEYADLSKMEFIPNGMFNKIEKLIAKDGEEKVNILHSYSAYETRKPHMSKEQTDEFKYPCVTNINAKSEIGKMYWSSTNERGHFGTPKVIFGRFGSANFIDLNGEYGMTQDCSGIINNDFFKIKEIFENDDFLKLMQMCDFGGICHKTLKFSPINRKIISTFRKDFWKEFLND